MRQCLLSLSAHLAPCGRDVGETVAALQTLARVQADIGETEAARATFAEAEGLILRRFGALTRDFALPALSRSLIDAGLYSEARQVSEGAEKEMRRVQIQLEIANAYLKAGQRTEGELALTEAQAALKAATIRGPRDSTRHYALIELAIGQTRLGQFDTAIGTISEIPDTSRRQYGLQKIVETLATMGEVVRAQEIAMDITETLPRIKSLNALAEAFYGAGNHAEADRFSEQAMSVATQIEGAGDSAYGLIFVAKTMVNIGNVETAINLVMPIQRPFENSMGLSLVAKELAATGMTEEALTLFQHAQEKASEIERPAKQGTALANIGTNMAQSGFLPEALILAQNAGSNYARSVIYANLARMTED